MLTFVVPVRHHANAKDWGLLVEYLRATIAAFERQESDQWQAVIVANSGSALPDFSSRVMVHRVDFAPNPHHELGSTDLESFRDAIRIDKGRRVLAGMRAAGRTDYFMVIDDDDFVSNRIAGFVEQSSGAPGWYFREGFVWQTGGRLLYRYEPFHLYCGTSHIVRADLMDLTVGDDAAGMAYIKKMLGSHISIADVLATNGTPLATLPFAGAVYRVGHAGSHSKSQPLLSKFLLNRETLRHPLYALRSLRRFRVRNAALDREFFGTAAD